jgi:alpha-tubulin suppressor-like RCC1 family protein
MLVITSAAAPAPTATAALAPVPSASLAGGAYHHCAIRADQTVACWGRNDVGQLGNNTTISSPTPQLVSGLTDVVAIDAMINTTCALRSDGTVACWGDNDDGQLGAGLAVPFTTVPVDPIGIVDAVAIEVGGAHACALGSDGTVACWGQNGLGQLGNGTTTTSNVPVSAQFLTDAATISAGGTATCSVRLTGELSCWGAGLPGDVDETRPTDVAPSLEVRSVAVGHQAICVITVDHAAMCAGTGPLGDGSDEPNPEFVEVALGSALDVAVAADACAITPDAGVYCWGAGEPLVLAVTQPVGDSTLPMRVPDLVDVVDLHVAPAHACARSADAIVRCWGTNLDGQLQFEPTSRLGPGFEFPDLAATDVSAGLATCAVSVDATVLCAGFDVFAPAPFDFSGPRVVDGLVDIGQVATQFTHNCAVDTSGDVLCWGFNTVGEIGVPPLGEFTVEDSVVPPVRVDGVSGVVDIAVGASFSCASTGSTAYCWGTDADGQLGNDAAFVDSSSPVEVESGPTTTTVDTLDAGNGHACARVINAITSMVGCWGRNNHGELGNGTTDDQPTMVFPGVLVPASIATGGSHTCAIDGAADVWCWGDNSEGQLGIGTTTSHTTKQQLAGLPADPIQVVAGNSHTCVLLTTGDVHCWGDNQSRQVGQPSGDMHINPVQVPGVSNVVQISANFDTTCARRVDSSVTCWGDNGIGQAGALPTTPTPVVVDPGAPLDASQADVVPVVEPVTPARLFDTRTGQPTIDGLGAGSGPITGGTDVTVQVTGRAGVPDDATFAVLNLTAVRPSANGYLTAHACDTERPLAASLNYAGPAGTAPITLGNETIVALSSTGTACIYSSSPTDLTVDVTAYGTARGGYRATTPSRVLDSRAGMTTFDGQNDLSAPIEGGTEIELQIRGRAGVSGTAGAAVLYIAAVDPTGVGYLTAYPCDPIRPLASSLNFSTLPDGRSVNRGNEVIAPLDDDGKVCLFVSATTDLTVDLVGSIDPSTTYAVESPARLLETRPGQSTVDGEFELGAALSTGDEIELDVAGRAGVENDASAAVLNITAVNPSGVGYLTAWPCGTTRPTASSLNFTATPNTGSINGGNEVLAPLSIDGTVCLFVSQSTDLTVDVVGSV